MIHANILKTMPHIIKNGMAVDVAIEYNAIGFIPIHELMEKQTA